MTGRYLLQRMSPPGVDEARRSPAGMMEDPPPVVSDERPLHPRD